MKKLYDISIKLVRAKSCNLAILGFLLLLNVSDLSAQGTAAPVQVNSQLTPPNSIFLSDYANATLNKWPITLTLRDLTKTDYRVRLRITIESQTVRLQTKATFMPTGMYLSAGVPTQLPYDKLSAYLNPNNLEITGMDRATFSKSQRLPEGFYTFTVEVLDYQRGNIVSNASRSVAWIVQNDPPLLNLPYADKLRIQEPQQIQFQWTPRHTASPNSAFETEYIFRLWEIRTPNRNPNEVVRTSRPVFEHRTSLNSYFYSPVDYALVPGQSYAWQVQAVSNIGRDLFKNDGKSVVNSFQYGDECLPITGLGIEALDPHRIKVDWKGGWNHSGFVVQVRKKGTTEWKRYVTNIEMQVVFDLEADTEYQVQVLSKCGVLTAEESPIQTVSTFAKGENDFNCGAESDIPSITNREPIAGLQVGDKFEALGFTVRITEISGSGPYNGMGAIEIPLFNLASVEAELVNIAVNTDRKLIGGYVETTLNPAGPFIIGLDSDEPSLSEEGEGNGNDEGGKPEPDVKIDEVITSVGVDKETGIITVVSEDGETTTIDPNKENIDENGDGEVVIEDRNGDTWVVGPDGTVSQGQNTGGPSSPSTLPADAAIDFIVNFEESDQQQYGFDSKTLETLSSYYTQTQIRDNNYWLAWKSVASGRTDKVLAKQSSGDSFNRAIGFKTITGNLPITAASEDLTKTVTVQGTTHKDEQLVQAYVLQETQNDQGETTKEEIVLGELKMVSYDKLSQKVVIVPVNGVSAPAASTLSNELNRIYGQAVAEWEVVMAKNYTSEMSLAGLDDEGSSTLSAYSSAMNKFRRTYKRNNTIDKDAYYVFLMTGTGSSKLGYMPFKRQYGFIFTDNTTDITKTIAHELGHGAFRLRHTFSNKSYIASQGSTNNLMDYSNGTKLYKHQWDLVHNPENVNTLFEEDEESAMDGEFVSNNVLEILSSSNFLLGENNIKINFNIKNWENYINTTNWNSKNINDFSLIIILTNENNDVLFAKTKSLNQEKKIEWDGELFDNSVVLNSVNDSDFKFLIGIINSEFDDVDFTDAHISREHTPGTTVLKTANDNSYTTFVDLVIDRSIKVDPTWEEWEGVDEEAQKLVRSSFTAYKEFSNELGNTGNGVGKFFNNIDNPLEYLSDNTVEVEFLESSFRVLKSFAPKLEYVKKKLGDSRMKEIAKTCTYTLGMGIRFKTDGGKGISMHSFGTVVDIYPKANLFLKPNRSGKGEKEMIIFIKQVTKLDLADHKSRTPTKIVNAQHQFLSKFGNQKMTFDGLVALYGSIDAYNSSDNAYTFKDLNNKTIYNELLSKKILVESGFFEELPSYLNRIERLNSFLNEKYGEFTPLEAVIFSEEGREEFTDFKTKIQQLYNKLSPLYNLQVSDSLMMELFADINVDEFKEIAVIKLSKEYGRLFDIVNSDYQNSFNNFALELKKWNDAPVSENFGNKLFEEGFCNVPLDLIKAFREQPDITWGGMDWSGSNIDYMHFEISENKTLDYLKKP